MICTTSSRPKARTGRASTRSGRNSATSSSSGSASPSRPTTTTCSTRSWGPGGAERGRSRSCQNDGRGGVCFFETVEVRDYALPGLLELLLQVVVRFRRSGGALVLVGNHDLDLARVHRGRLVEEGGDQSGPEDDDADHDELQHHPRDRTPVDRGALHFLGRDPAQVEERKAERGMHERGVKS